MDTFVEDKDQLFSEAFAHLAAVDSSQNTSQVPLDEDLLKRVERSLDASTPKDLLWQLLATGEALLQNLQQDPRPLTRLLERTIALIPFDELQTTISPAKLEEGLNSPSIPIQLLCLAYLRKAADSPSGASFVASSSSLVQCLFTNWLSSESTEVAERSLEGIEALLAVDSQNTITVLTAGNGLGEAEGQGLFWRRVFYDPSVYSILFEYTSLSKPRRDLTIKKNLQMTTISQARLFDFIARAATFDWSAITTSSLPAVESRYVEQLDDSQPFGGVLRYAASHMIDSHDILMEVLRQDFFVKLLGTIEETSGQNFPPRVVAAIQQGAGVETTKDGVDAGIHL